MRRILPTFLLAGLLCMECLPAVAKSPINVGVFLPMSGNAAAYGQMEWSGIRTAHEMMAKVLGRDVKLVLEDTMSDKTKTAAAVKRLIETHKVVGIIGGATSADAFVGSSSREAAPSSRGSR